MGRSVETLSRAEHTVTDWLTALYQTVDSDTEEERDADEWEVESNYEWYEENIVSDLQALFPSLEILDTWEEYPYRETRFILGNAHTVVGFSHYSGVAAISLIPRGETLRYGDETETIGLSKHWISQVAAKMDSAPCWLDPLRPLGTFSNGERVYERTS